MTLSGRSRMKTNTPEDDNETFLNDAISLSEEEVNYPRPSGSRDFRSSNRNVDSVLSPISVRRDFHLHEDLLGIIEIFWGCGGGKVNFFKT